MPKKIKRTSNATYKAKYARYKAENRVQKNAIARLARHCKDYPNDEKAKVRLEEVKKSRPYKRNNVKTSHVWSPTEIYLAQLCNIRFQTPVVKRRSTIPEWKKTLQTYRDSLR